MLETNEKVESPSKTNREKPNRMLELKTTITEIEKKKVTDGLHIRMEMTGMSL